MYGPIYIFGCGGHGVVVADILRASGTPAAAFIDDAPPPGGTVFGLPVQHSSTPLPDGAAVILGVGDNAVRESVAARFSRFATAVHPSAVVAPDVVLGAGTVVMARAVVNPRTRVGCHAILNTGCVVDHDGALDDFVSIGPGAVLGGEVRVGHGSVVAIGATVLHGRTILEHTVVGAGAVVTRDLGPNCLAAGVPARFVRKREANERYL